MHKQIALAYGIAGLAVAFALITVLGSSANLFAGEVTPAAGPTSMPASQPTLAPEPTWAPVPAETERGVDAAADMPVEYVYIDEPAPARRGHDDDDDDRSHTEDDDRDDRHEEREHRRGHRESDDD